MTILYYYTLDVNVATPYLKTVKTHFRELECLLVNGAAIDASPILKSKSSSSKLIFFRSILLLS